VAKEGRGENEVMQPGNPAANAAAPANPAANAPRNALANATGYAANNAADAANIQGNPPLNPRCNAGTQPPLVQADCAEGSRRHRIRDEVEIAQRANYDREHGVPDPLDANNPIQATDLWIMHYQQLLATTIAMLRKPPSTLATLCIDASKRLTACTRSLPLGRDPSSSQK
jgi:hypothetical protein